MEGQDRDDRDTPSPPLPPPPGHGTYIVQFPKDQVYRVPPRENAVFMEKFRNLPVEKKKRRTSCSSCCCCCCCSSRLLLTMSLILVSIIAIVGITFATLYFIYSPTGPKFSVTSVVVKKGNNKQSPPRYEIWLKAQNPNKRLSIDYDTNANVSMMFDKTKVAVAKKFPLLDQDSGASTNVKIELIGTGGPLPKQMDKSMKDDKTKTNVAFKLEMKLGLRMIAAGLQTWTMKSEVVCHFKVDTLRDATRILSQQCDTDFGQY